MTALSSGARRKGKRSLGERHPRRTTNAFAGEEKELTGVERERLQENVKR